MDKSESRRIFRKVRRDIANLDQRVSSLERAIIGDALQRGQEFGYTVRLNDDGVWPDPPEGEDTYDLSDLGDLPY